MSVALWRIAVASRSIAPTDLSGRGAERTGGRWNSVGRPKKQPDEAAAQEAGQTELPL